MKVSALVVGSTALILACAGAARGQSVQYSGMIVLDSTATNGTLTLSGSARAQVPAIYVNSSASQATRCSGSAVIDSYSFKTVGGASLWSPSACTCAVSHIPVPVSDPCSGLSLPTADPSHDLNALSFSGGTRTASPGYYSHGITAGGGASVTFSPGLYVLGGNGLVVSGASSISGDGVSFMIVGNGKVNISGGSTAHLTPMSSGPMAGVVIAQYAMDTQSMTISGGSGMFIGGTIYAPGAQLTISGSSQVIGDGPQIGDMVVAKRVTVSGSGLIKIGGQQHSQVVMPPNAPLAD